MDNDELQSNRREQDPMLHQILDTLRTVNSRVDKLFETSGKVDALNEKMNGFIVLMERVEQRANGDVVELKERMTKVEGRVATIEKVNTFKEGSTGVTNKLLDGILGRLILPVSCACAAAAIVAHFINPPAPQVIQVPANTGTVTTVTNPKR